MPTYLSVQVKSSGSSPTLQSRTVTPSSSTQYITPQSRYDALSQVTVQGDSNLVGSNIKKGTSIFRVNGNVVPWDRPNTFTYWCRYTSYTSQGTTYFLNFYLYPSADDVSNQTNRITQLPFASTQECWTDSFYLHAETDTYYLTGVLSFHSTTYTQNTEDSSRNRIKLLNTTGYREIYHLNRGTHVSDYFDSWSLTTIYEFNPEPYLGFPKTEIDSRMNVSDIKFKIIPMYGSKIYY